MKYAETGEMYARMMQVSRRLKTAIDGGAGVAGGTSGDLIDQARTALYRGQCNCSYWHGAFGGVYLPHLRNAVYQQLIIADNLLDRVSGRGESYVEATAEDFNFDGRQEIQLANGRLLALIAPSRGGQIYELDVRSICHNLLATLTRRPEAYHRKILAGNDGRNDVAGISDKVVFKHANLDQRLQYDATPRKSLLDHFYDPAPLSPPWRWAKPPSGAISSIVRTRPACAAIPIAFKYSLRRRATWMASLSASPRG